MRTDTRFFAPPNADKIEKADNPKGTAVNETQFGVEKGAK